ncbi:MAG TPA: cytochrome P460 family protein [Abditibacteriaceae bacterium]|jgi:hypothetical protein
MNNLRPFLFCSAVLTLAVLAHAKPGQQKTAQQKTAKPQIPAIRNYRKWNLANAKPHFVAAPLAVACAPAPMTRERATPNPHADKWVRVWVNETGRVPLLQQKTPVFPRGAVIVKEKLATANSQKPELLTVMIKRAAGFDAKNGDWEYYVMNGEATRVRAGGKLQNCQGCHVPLQESGYVFRDYLPEDVRRALK